MNPVCPLPAGARSAGLAQPASIPSLLLDAATTNPDAACVIGAGAAAEWMSYRQVAAEVGRIAALLAREGIVPGMRVSIMLPRSPEYLFAYFAVLALGGVAVPLGTEMTAAEVAVDLDYCGVTLAICNRSTLGRHPASVPQFVLEKGRSQPAEGAIDWLRQRACGIEPEEPALLLHTSGSLQRPKRVMLSHANVSANALAHARSVRAAADDRMLITLPMHFGYCNTAQICAQIATGGAIVIAGEGFSPSAFCATVARNRVTTTTLVPTMLYALERYRGLEQFDLSSLRQILFGGAPVDADRLERLAERMPHVDFVQTYGLTEAGPRVTTRRHAQCAPASVGRPIPGVEIALCDEAGNAVTRGQVGEIHVRGPGVMMGYYRRPAETARVLSHGWLRTGDLARENEVGEFELVGRRSNVLIRAGINVYPEQIEQVLMMHPAVAEAAVVPEPHREQGEVPLAVLVADRCGPCDDADMVRHCSAYLAPHKVPWRFEWRATLPRTYTHKIARGQLRASPAGEAW